MIMINEFSSFFFSSVFKYLLPSKSPSVQYLYLILCLSLILFLSLILCLYPRYGCKENLLD